MHSLVSLKVTNACHGYKIAVFPITEIPEWSPDASNGGPLGSGSETWLAFLGPKTLESAG